MSADDKFIVVSLAASYAHRDSWAGPTPVDLLCAFMVDYNILLSQCITGRVSVL